MGTYLLIQTIPGHTWEVMRALRDRPDVTQAEIVAGAYDIIAVSSTESIHDVRELPGVLRALECVVIENHAVIAV
jgi:hypothetical protein